MIPAAMSAIFLFGAAAQTPAPRVDRVIGEITKVDAGAKQLTIKPASGAEVAAMTGDRTIYLRISPGETDIKKAVHITFADITAGDRARVRGHFAADQKSIAALEVLIMTKAELAQKHEHEREEWQRRSLAGPVTAVNPETKEITIRTHTREGAKPVAIEVGDHVEFQKYSPESVRFSDAKPSSFAELKVGDQLRVLGDKNEDGTRIKAEEIVFGSFRDIAGVIKSIDPNTKAVTLTDLVAHKPVTIRITADTSMRRLPQGLAMMLARRVHGAQGGGESGAAQPRPASNAEGLPGPARQGNSKPGAGGPPTEPGQNGGMRRGNMDFQDMLEHLPPMPITDLKPGDAIMLSGSSGADPEHVTAINLLAGVEPLLTAAPRGGQDIFGSWNFDIGPEGGGE